MYRSPLLIEPASVIPLSEESFDWLGRRNVTTPQVRGTTESVQCFFAPIHYESNYAYPLIVWLHGPQSNEQQLQQVMPLINMRNHVAVAPRGTKPNAVDRLSYGWSHTPEAIAEAGQRVRDCVESAQHRFHIHPERIFVAGYAEGGTMAHRIGMEFPELFAGAISLGGPVPRGSRPLRHINRVRQLPLLLAVSPDQNYSINKVMEDLRFLHSAGCSLNLRLYPEGDQLTTTMLSDMDCWVMEQSCPTAVAS